MLTSITIDNSDSEDLYNGSIKGSRKSSSSESSESSELSESSDENDSDDSDDDKKLMVNLRKHGK